MSILMVSPPVVTVDDASKAAAQMYGWQAEAVALTGERDKNYLLRTVEAGDVVLNSSILLKKRLKPICKYRYCCGSNNTIVR